jgi:hypothetical protein
MVGDQCLTQGITDSLTIKVITGIAIISLQEKIGVVYVNEDENNLFGMDLGDAIGGYGQVYSRSSK